VITKAGVEWHPTECDKYGRITKVLIRTKQEELEAWKVVQVVLDAERFTMVKA